MWLNVPGLIIIVTLCCLDGLVIFAVYSGCDLGVQKKITSNDQVNSSGNTTKLIRPFVSLNVNWNENWKLAEICFVSFCLCLSVSRFVSLFMSRSASLLVYLSVYLSVCLSCHRSRKNCRVRDGRVNLETLGILYHAPRTFHGSRPCINCMATKDRRSDGR